jgi:hypothetical protein
VNQTWQDFLELMRAGVYGNMAEWVAAVGAVLALIFAALAVRASRKANAHQAEQIRRLKQDDRERERREREAQARSVAIWYTKELASTEWHYQVFVSNVSTLPVANILFAVLHDGKEWYVDEPFIPSNPRFNSEHLDEVFNRVMARALESPYHVSLSISFDDMNGNRWHRGVNGELHPYPGQTERQRVAQLRANRRVD